MPELPEITLSANLIRPIIKNQFIINTYPTCNSRYAQEKPENHQAFLEFIRSEPCQVLDVQNKGKFMYWTLSNGWFIFATFGMTGQFSPTRGKHPCFIFHHAPSLEQTQEYQELVFNDPRHFGSIRFSNNSQDLKDKLDELGWDPLHMSLEKNLPWLNMMIQKATQTMAQILMDQTIFAGVGNYIKAEALYRVGMSPWRRGIDLSTDDIAQLCQVVVDICQESLAFQGASFKTFTDPFGEGGKYSSCFKIYGRKTDSLGHTITRESTSDRRTTHWCKQCQK